MKKNIFIVFLAICTTNSGLFAQFGPNEHSAALIRTFQGFQTPPPAPAFNGTLTETLDHVFDSITALSPIKGFNAAMRLPDGSVWKRAEGLATQIPTTTPLTTGHLMGMGSITKTFVATTLLLLSEEGLLSLDDSIGKFVGPYPNIAPHATVRQLLSHRSGYNDYLNENPATGNAWLTHLDSVWSVETLLNNYVLAPNFAPDDSFSYSNTNYLLAGVIIENLTGQPWYQVVREKVLEPLGLTHTFAYPWELPGNQPLSHVWADADGNGTVDDLQGLGLPDVGLFSLGNSAGCLITTPEDLTKFAERVFGGELLQPATLAAMQTDYQQDGSGSLYGLGAASFPLPQNIENWGHNGDLLYKSVVLYFPAENMALAVQQNDDRSYDPSQPVIDMSFVFISLLDAYLNYTASTGTDELESGMAALSAFPNPAGQSVRLKFPGKTRPDFPLEVTLRDVNGKVLHTQSVDNENDEIYTGHLVPGVYALTAGRFSFMVVKM